MGESTKRHLKSKFTLLQVHLMSTIHHTFVPCSQNYFRVTETPSEREGKGQIVERERGKGQVVERERQGTGS